MAPQPMKRLHSLDALRAAMMLLGFVLHSAVSYVTTPLPNDWPYQDRQTSALFDCIVFGIHLFRMPTFFVMAGFFAAYLYYREGPPGFLAHRTRRVLLPLVVGFLVLFPFIRGGFIFARSGGGSDGFAAAVAAMKAAPYADAMLGHLWFLSFLFIFCLVAGALVPLIERIPEPVKARVVHAFGSVAQRPAGCLAFGLLSAATMLPMSKPALDTSLTIMPIVRVLVAYSVFFVFGWLLFLRPEVVSAFGRQPWRYVASGAVVSVTYLVINLSRPFGGGLALHLPGVLTGGVAMWLLIYGVTGVFVRYFEHPNAPQRYLSDASYWMYLVHLPFVLWLQGAMASWPVSPVVKFTIALTGAAAVTLVTYHYFVRATAIGAFLNGRRFERALPQLATGPA